MEVLTSLSFDSESSEGEGESSWFLAPGDADWSRSLEWETRIPPLEDEAAKDRLCDEFMRWESEYLGLVSGLSESTEEVIELEELLGRVEPGSLHHHRILQALEDRFYDNHAFRQQASRYEELHGKLSAIHARVADWEARRDAEFLSGSLSSLELESSSSECGSCVASPSLPPLPALPRRPKPSLLSRPRAKSSPRLNPEALDFVPQTTSPPPPVAFSTPTPLALTPTAFPPLLAYSKAPSSVGKRTPLRAPLVSLTPFLSPFPLVGLPCFAFSPSPLPPSPPQLQRSRARKRLNLRH